jgi:hypothetical protein
MMLLACDERNLRERKERRDQETDEVPVYNVINDKHL